jgi:CheY-like chemotaxis protein
MPMVLIVDDDDLVRQLIRELLVRRHYTVIEATDVHAALDALRQNVVAVALVDRRLPTEDGFWLLDRMRGEFPAVAIVLSTGDDSIPPRIVAEPGVVGYLGFLDHMVRIL